MMIEELAGQVMVDRIALFEAELLVPRRGSLKVRVNLEAGTLSWQVGRQWCNNFIRTLSEEQTEALGSMVQDHDLDDVKVAMPQETAVRPENQPELLLTLVSASGKHKSYIIDQSSDFWRRFQRLLEKISRTPFQL